MESYLQFKRPSRNCLVCGVSLPELERHPSVLHLSDKDEAVRQDICPTCWGRMVEKQYFSYWITRRYQAGPSPEERRLARHERNEALWALFNALMARREDEDLEPQLYLLAHLLMKHRILQYHGRTEDQRLKFLHPGSQETFLIADLPIDQISFVDVMENVESQVRQYAPGATPEGEEYPAEAIADSDPDA